jgi:hypothetical protein
MKFFENEEEQAGILLDRDQVLTVKAPHTIQDAIKAFKNVDNYGIYISNMRGRKVTDKDIQAHFGPSSPRLKATLEKERGRPFAIKTKQAIDDFVKAGVKNPDIVNYDIEGNTLVFTVENNPQRNKLKNVIDTVLTSAGIDYKLRPSTEGKKQKLKKIVSEVLNRKNLKK